MPLSDIVSVKFHTKEVYHENSYETVATLIIIFSATSLFGASLIETRSSNSLSRIFSDRSKARMELNSGETYTIIDPSSGITYSVTDADRRIVKMKLTAPWQPHAFTIPSDYQIQDMDQMHQNMEQKMEKRKTNINDMIRHIQESGNISPKMTEQMEQMQGLH